MAEVQSRPRGGGRAGRGGRSSRGGDRSVSKQGSGDASASVPLEEQGELGQLKKQYMTQLVTLRELFPDWTDEDCVFALQESDGDLQTTIEKISEGAVSQFSDVKKKTREKPKAKPVDPGAAAKDAKDAPAGAARGRGRGALDSGRGGRGRGTERSRGRGARGTTSHAPRQSVPTTTTAAATESTSWADSMNQAPAEPSWETATPVATGAGSTEGQWGSVVSSLATPATASEGQKSSLIPEGATKSWASIAQPKPPPAAPKQPLLAETMPPFESSIAQDIPSVIEKPATPPGLTRPTNILTPQASSEGTMDLTPPKDQLTEDNLENLPDTSLPPSSETVASTRDPRSAAGTPYASAAQAPISRPGLSGYAASAWKATAVPGRSASFQRRMMEQREAVVMPGNHAVNSTALQFGSMNLNGDAKPLDVDEDREEPETRTQPPQQSPSQPRASLPPAPYQQAPEPVVPEGLPTPKPSTLQQTQASALGQQPSPSAGLGPQISGQATAQSGHAYGQGQYSRYGAAALGQEHQAPTPKPYDPFSSQLNHPQLQQEQQSVYPSHSQPSAQAPQHAQSSISQAAGDFASQYPSEQRANYSNYYSSSYGQQTGAAQDHPAVSQRSGSGFGPSEAYGSNTQTQVPSRLGDAQNSGSNTPNPPMSTQSHQTQQMHQQHGQGSHGAYPYPYYSGYGSYNSYMNQFPSQYSYNQQGYAAQFGGKGGIYNQPHHGYGMSPQTSFEHSSSPANAGGYGSSMMHGRDSGLSGFSEYGGRSGSAQQSQGAHQSASAGSFGGMGESYGRSSSGAFQNQQYGIPSSGVSEETLKPFAEPKSGPSPALGQPGRPPSGLNASASGGQSNLPPGQSQHGFGAGYPSHLQQQLHGNHGSQQYSGLGGLGGGHQGGAASHQGGNYGGYGSGFSSSYGNYGRGGWGGNYGH